MSGERCPWKIHYGVTQELTTQCDMPEHLKTTEPTRHEGPGIMEGQRITWMAGDRHEYTGQWPGYCDKLPGRPYAGGCCLHKGHVRGCAP